MSNALSDLIAHAESGGPGYNAYNRGTYTGPDHKQHIRGPNGPIDLSSMTLGEVMDRQKLHPDNPDRLFAVGKYQITTSTMQAAASYLTLDRNQPFTPELQERIFSEYLLVNKQHVVHDYIVGKHGATLEAAQHGLAKEWASFGDPEKGGASYYGGANHASVTPSQSEQALEKMRESYQSHIGEGMSPREAWLATTHSGPSSTPHTPWHETRTQSSQTVPGNDPHHDGGTVHSMQQQLAKLGYTDAHGHPLPSHGESDLATKHAVESFQSEYGLKVDGIAGPKTMHMIGEALAQQHAQSPTKTPLSLDDPSHSAYPLFKQNLQGVEQLNAEHGIAPSPRDVNIAGALTADAAARGMTHVDRVLTSEDGSRLFAVQNMGDLLKERFAAVDTMKAIATPLEHSSVQWMQVMQQNQSQLQALAQSPPTQAMGRTQ